MNTLNMDHYCERHGRLSENDIEILPEGATNCAYCGEMTFIYSRDVECALNVANKAFQWAINWISAPVADDYETQEEFDTDYQEWEETYLKYTGLIWPRRPNKTLGK